MVQYQLVSTQNKFDNYLFWGYKMVGRNKDKNKGLKYGKHTTKQK